MARRRRSRQPQLIDLVFPLAILIALFWYSSSRFHVHIPWTLMLLPALLIVFVILIALAKNLHLSNAGFNEIDRMSGEDFESVLYIHLRRAGWRVQKTPRTGDFGADLVGADPQGRRCVIQAKRWKNQVGVKAVQEVIGAKAYYNAEIALVITNNHFTKSAWEMAQKTGVQVWGRKRLAEIIKREKAIMKTTGANSNVLRG